MSFYASCQGVMLSGHQLDLCTRLLRWRTGGRFVVEAVGFNRWLVNACRAAGLSIVVTDAVKLSLAKLEKKTDRRDTYELARRLFLLLQL